MSIVIVIVLVRPQVIVIENN